MAHIHMIRLLLLYDVRNAIARSQFRQAHNHDGLVAELYTHACDTLLPLRTSLSIWMEQRLYPHTRAEIP